MNDNTQNKVETFRVGKTIPSRPHKLTIIGLIGVVIGFFVIVLSHQDEELQRTKVAPAPVAAAQTK